MRLWLGPLLMLSGGCAVAVYHPEKGEAEMKTDIERCTDEANGKYMFDPVTALHHAYGCMEALGYTRERPGLAHGVQSAMENRPERRPEAKNESAKKAPVQPCRVPCKSR